ncbi:MAG: hypothetical protein ABSH53_03475 [Holophaga sp.]|jgi:hypothetical protein
MKESQADGPMADLELALFQVGGVRYGVEAGQVAGTEVFQGPGAVGVRWFHEIMGYPDGRVHYRDPVVLTLHGAVGRIVVDGLEHLACVPLCDLRPFPPLAAPAARARGLWAVAKRGEHLVLLVDFDLLNATDVALKGS